MKSIKNKIYWTLPILAFGVQWLSLAIYLTVWSMMTSRNPIDLFDVISQFRDNLNDPLILLILMPEVIILPVVGIAMGYGYITAVSRGRGRVATIIFALCGVAFILLHAIATSNYFDPIIVAIPILYIAPLSISATLYNRWLHSQQRVTMAKICTISLLILMCTIMGGVLFGVIGNLKRMFRQYDNFAKELTIPEDVAYKEPLRTPSTHLAPTEGELILYHGIQPGTYNYELHFTPTNQGAIYLKAYEVTHSTPLSLKSLKASSKIDIETTSDKVEIFTNPNRFTIYEGDWGDYYLARFEVWFTPRDGSPEVKITEQTFKIEGWQR